jgi:hypothetical protein
LNKYFDAKDYNYWIFILVLLLIGLSTSKLGNDSAILNYVSFAGTITSILLAVVAIIYSFFQNFSNASLNQKLIESADKIENATRRVDETLSSIENVTDRLGNVPLSVNEATKEINRTSNNIELASKKIDDTIKSFEITFNEMFTRFEATSIDMQQTLSERLDSTSSEINNVSRQIIELKELGQKTQTSKTTTKALTPTVYKELAVKFVGASSTIGIVTLYFINKMYEHKIKNIEIAKALNYVLDNNHNYAYGYLVAVSCTGLINFEYVGDKFDTINITAINSIFISKINSKVLDKNLSEKFNVYINKVDEFIKSVPSEL